MQEDVEEDVARERHALVAHHEQERVARVPVERAHSEARVRAAVEQRRHQQPQVAGSYSRSASKIAASVAPSLRKRRLDRGALAPVALVLEQPHALIPVPRGGSRSCRPSSRR